MTIHPNLLNKRALIFLKGGYRYQGIVVHEDDGYYHLDDEKTQRLVILAKSEVTTIEIIRGAQ